MAEANRCDQCHEYVGCCLCFEREPDEPMPLHPDDIANLPGAPDPWEQAHEAWNMEELRGEMAEGAD